MRHIENHTGGTTLSASGRRLCFGPAEVSAAGLLHRSLRLGAGIRRQAQRQTTTHLALAETHTCFTLCSLSSARGAESWRSCGWHAPQVILRLAR